jgi:glycosyltransferase involved in cell wall biosynthesis
MAPYVREANCGALCDAEQPTSIAAAIRSILEAPAAERAAFGTRALAAAHEHYNRETQVGKLFAEYGRLTGSAW